MLKTSFSTSPPQPLFYFFGQKNSDQEFLDNHDENKVCSKKQSHAPTDAQSVDNRDIMLEHAPMLEKNDAANSEPKCKRKFIRRKESKVEPINNAPQIVAKPVCNRLKHKTCNTCGISFRKKCKRKKLLTAA
ncbi:hypothetical protein P9112_000073 [Eukaryota sp. TZLM1-RC]